MNSLSFKKIISFGLGLLMIIIFLLFVLWREKDYSGQLEVIFLDVGQGDSILIKSPYGQNILIDGGPDNQIIEKLGENLPFYERQIDLMILTHPHADHVTGLVEVLKRYQVDQIFSSGVLHTSPEYLAWLKVIREKNIPFAVIKTKKRIIFRPSPDDSSLDLKEDQPQELILEILYPDIDLSNKHLEELNNSSLVVKLSFGAVKWLFTGDIEEEVERELVNKRVDLAAQILKIAHHGSNSSSSFDFLQKVNPELAVIQVGQNNKFGHPSSRVIKRLERKGVKILRNDQNGEIKITSDGLEVNITTER